MTTSQEHIIENPAGTEGFGFLEFSAPDSTLLENLFKQLGFQKTAVHHAKAISCWQQGSMTFIVNAEKKGFAADFAKAHGPCVCGMAFFVNDQNHAYEHCIAQNATPFKPNYDHWCADKTKIIRGIGDNLLYFIDKESEQHLYDGFEVLPQNETTSDAGLFYIDHVTNNVYQGHMDKWAEFYERLFNFREIRFFNIKGKYTGLHSRAMTSPCNKIKIPINEATDDLSQIAEYLKEYKGEGIQHIAMGTNDIYATIETLRKNGIQFLTVPDTYFKKVDERLPEHSEPLERMQKNKILIDGTTKDSPPRLLLQIFTNTVIGPVFFEIIQRKGDEGFGEGNFQALFDSIELDQIERGIIKKEEKP